MTSIYSIVSKLFYTYAQGGLARLQVMASAPVQTILETKPDLLNFLILLAIFYFSFLVLISTVKTVFRIVVNVIKLCCFIATLGVILWVYTRGLDGCIQDINYLMSTGQHADLYGENDKFTERVQTAAQKQFNDFLSHFS
jgi:hypothetical protein